MARRPSKSELRIADKTSLLFTTMDSLDKSYKIRQKFHDTSTLWLFSVSDIPIQTIKSERVFEQRFIELKFDHVYRND